jgi:transcriptional regulator with XRE-family HTH domain
MSASGSPTENIDHRQRLASLAKERRQEQGLSVRQAADAADIARGTWTALEDGTRKTSDHNYRGIERALHWAPGSIAAILDGGDPMPQPDTDAAPITADLTPPPRVDDAFTRVMRSNLPTEKKRHLVALLTAEQAEADARRAERAELMIQLASDER